MAMPDAETSGTLRILTERAGTIAEISRFLADLEKAYLALYDFERAWSFKSWRSNIMYLKSGFPYPILGGQGLAALTPETVLPEDRLIVTSVRIESPGFWEVVASLNPLQQIREYLNDRHKRRQDKDFRDAAERDRLLLENELIQRQVWEKENSILGERIKLLRDLGLSDQEIRQLVWAQVGEPLAQLGRHQDSRLIGGAE
jgi:hypothetical protein